MPEDFYEIDPGDHSKPEVLTTARFAWDADTSSMWFEESDDEAIA